MKTRQSRANWRIDRNQQLARYGLSHPSEVATHKVSQVFRVATLFGEFAFRFLSKTAPIFGRHQGKNPMVMNTVFALNSKAIL
jgi:hypothetical protein